MNKRNKIAYTFLLMLIMMIPATVYSQDSTNDSIDSTESQKFFAKWQLATYKSYINNMRKFNQANIDTSLVNYNILQLYKWNTITHIRESCVYYIQKRGYHPLGGIYSDSDSIIVVEIISAGSDCQFLSTHIIDVRTGIKYSLYTGCLQPISKSQIFKSKITNHLYQNISNLITNFNYKL